SLFTYAPLRIVIPIPQSGRGICSAKRMGLLRLPQKRLIKAKKPALDINHLVHCWTEFHPPFPTAPGGPAVKRTCFLLSAIVCVCTLSQAFAQKVSPNISVPSTTVSRSDDVGQRAHTNHIIRVGVAPFASSFAETPQSMRSVYKLPSTGGGGTIALVGAFHYPTA